MTPTQSNRFPGTQSPAPMLGAVNDAPTVSTPQGSTETTTPPALGGRSIPSAETTGSKLLRYTIQDAGNGGRVISTQV